ncbi:NAD(P)-binding protein [Thozetella sp. PMI_491]|nr:NAD(P)-binding protein [Thozetella sp. PMI_491]
MSGWNFTKTFHRKPYPAISPTRPELSQAGKTAVVVGANTGVGLAIARAFGLARAATVYVLGRREESNKTAVAQLSDELSAAGSNTKYIPYTLDIAKASDIEHMWDFFEASGVAIDILVLCACTPSEQLQILELGTSKLWSNFDINMRAQVDLTERFYKHKNQNAAGTKYVVNISTFAIHDWINAAPKQPGYGVTKAAAATVFQSIASAVPPETMQIVSMNPGPVFTDAAKKEGYTEADFNWNDPNLPGHFAVWCASPEAKFLHGRFVWNEWDVDELKAGPIRDEIDKDPLFLKVGVKGL